MITSQTVFPIKIASTTWDDKHLLGLEFEQELNSIYNSMTNKSLGSATGDHETTIRVMNDVINIPTLAPLKSWVRTMLNNMWEEIGYEPNNLSIERSWINKFRKGSRLRPHAHGSTEMVMTYYHKVPEGSSSITFYNPFDNSTGMAPFANKSLTIKPYDGLLLAWPGFLWHEVNEQPIDSERIAISMHVHQSSYFLTDRWREVH